MKTAAVVHIRGAMGIVSKFLLQNISLCRKFGEINFVTMAAYENFTQQKYSNL